MGPGFRRDSGTRSVSSRGVGHPAGVELAMEGDVDFYTKAVLTVIVIALAVIVLGEGGRSSVCIVECTAPSENMSSRSPCSQPVGLGQGAYGS